MGLRIGLVGAPCTGKTTLAKAVAEKLNLTFIGESFEGAQKQCEMRGLRISKGPGEAWPNYFQRVWYEASYKEIVNFTKGIAWDLEAREEFVGDNFITDSAAPSQIVSGLLYNTFLEDVSDLAGWLLHQGQRIEHYTNLYHLPVSELIGLEDDNRRPTNPNIQKAFNFMLMGVLDHIDTPSVEFMEYSSLEERVELIFNQCEQTKRGLIQ